MSIHPTRPRVLSNALLILAAAYGLVMLPARGNAAEGPTTRPASPATRPVVVQIGDLLCVGITGLDASGDVETFKTARVDPHGGLSLYYVGSIKVAGLSYSEAEKAIAAAYREGGVVSHPGVSVNALPSSKTAPAESAIGPGDRLSIKISDLSPNRMTSRILTVNPAGTVGLPFLGQLQLAGLSEAEAERLIARRFKEEAVIRNAEISVLRLAPDEATEPTVNPPQVPSPK